MTEIPVYSGSSTSSSITLDVSSSSIALDVSKCGSTSVCYAISHSGEALVIRPGLSTKADVELVEKRYGKDTGGSVMSAKKVVKAGYVDDLLKKATAIHKDDVSFSKIDFSRIAPTRRETDIVVLIDGDIIAYRSSATCEGVFYTHPALVDEKQRKIRVRYKKDMDKALDKMDEEFKKKDSPIRMDRRMIKKGKETEPVNYATHNVDMAMESIMRKMMHEFPDSKFQFVVYLSGESNFRTTLYPKYKASRKALEKPVHLDACKERLMNLYDAAVSVDCEADDMLGIEQTAIRRYNPRQVSIIVSVDKDLLMIPGLHFNPVTGESKFIHHNEAMFNFYKQVLTGDRVDDIEGLKGVGPVTAARILLHGDEDSESLSSQDKSVPMGDIFYTRVFDAYIENLYPEFDTFDKDTQIEVLKSVAERIYITGHLLWIQRDTLEVWAPPFKDGIPKEYRTLIEGTGEPSPSVSPSPSEEIPF